jgi:DNA-binding response OmpR family regulator
VLNHKERGTTFIIRFPVTHSRPQPESRPGFSGKRIKEARFLIVADEGIARDLLARCLRDRGAAVRHAAVSEALKLLGKRPYDMVFLGVDSAPERTAKIVSRIRALAGDASLALLGGPKIASGYGADMVFAAPLHMERVLEQVQRTLRKGTPP